MAQEEGQGVGVDGGAQVRDAGSQAVTRGGREDEARIGQRVGAGGVSQETCGGLQARHLPHHPQQQATKGGAPVGSAQRHGGAQEGGRGAQHGSGRQHQIHHQLAQHRAKGGTHRWRRGHQLGGPRGRHRCFQPRPSGGRGGRQLRAATGSTATATATILTPATAAARCARVRQRGKHDTLQQCAHARVEECAGARARQESEEKGDAGGGRG